MKEAEKETSLYGRVGLVWSSLYIQISVREVFSSNGLIPKQHSWLLLCASRLVLFFWLCAMCYVLNLSLVFDIHHMVCDGIPWETLNMRQWRTDAFRYSVNVPHLIRIQSGVGQKRAGWFLHTGLLPDRIHLAKICVSQNQVGSGLVFTQFDHAGPGVEERNQES